MSLRIKEKVRKIRRSLSWHTASGDAANHLDELRGSFSHSSSNSLGQSGLPGGWESAIDKDGRTYYINHNENVSTYNDPRKQLDVEYEYAETRVITLSRDDQLGFGFVAGSERPVVVRCVTEEGPSDGLLLPGDQIHEINNEDVREAPRSRVIELVKSSEKELVLTVSQPPTISTEGKKSILLNAAKKQQRLKRDFSASRVRFNEDSLAKKKRSSLSMNNRSDASVSHVLKVHIETNQTRSFKYDGFTLVKDVLHALQEKLDIRCIEHFGLVLHNIRSPLSAKMVILSNTEKVKQVVEQLIEDGTQVLFRIVYVPRDAYDLLRKDSISFQYFYTQCCQDVIKERFSSDLKCDVALRLASLHMQEHAIDRQIPFQKISIKLIEREFGLSMFLNPSMLRAVRPKELRKMLAHFMKMNQGLIAPGQKQVTPLQAKLHYMKIVSELRSFGGKCFLATLVDRRAEVMLLVGPKCGISQVTDIKSFTLHMLADFDLIEEITVQSEDSGATKLVNVLLSDKNLPTLGLSMMNTDAKDFLTFVQGYHNLFCGSADIIRHLSLRETIKDPGDLSRRPHTPPILTKLGNVDINKNESGEPDYATIEDVQNSAQCNATDTPKKPPLPLPNKENPEPRLRSGSTSMPVKVCNVLLPHQSGNTSSLSSQEPTHCYSNENAPELPMTSMEDSPPPTSSIDDLIDDDVDSSITSSRGLIQESNVGELTVDCMNELHKLDNAGILLDPRMFKDKGVYLSPPSPSLDLTTLPPPPDDPIQPISSPSVIPPPPPHFTDGSVDFLAANTDREIGTQMQAVDAIHVQDSVDKESGIDSDDSGTETLNSTDNTSGQSHDRPTSSNQTDSKNLRANQQQDLKVTSQQMPASSLRSRLQEHRAKAKQQAESIQAQQLPVYTSPVKPDPITSTAINSSRKLANPQPVSSNTTAQADDIICSVENDLDLRMTQELMQFTEDSPSNPEDTDHAQSRADHVDANNPCTPHSAVPPMMLNDSQVDVSTEEEDNISLNNNDLAEPVYMNSEIEIALPAKLPTRTDQLTVAAIDEALDNLSCSSDVDQGSVTSPPALEPNKDLSKLTANKVSDSSNIPSSEEQTVVKQNSATIHLVGVDVQEKEHPTKPNVTPQPPPRRRKGLRGSVSMASLISDKISTPSKSTVTSGQPLSALKSQTFTKDQNEDSGKTPGSSRIYQRSISDFKETAKLGQSNEKHSLSHSGNLANSGHSLSHLNLSSTTQYTNNPISRDLSILRAKSSKKSKQERASRTASVIGVPTNITCTAGEVLANLVPISRDTNSSFRAQVPHTLGNDVKLTSRNDVFEDIFKTAEGQGIIPAGLVEKDEVEAGVRRRHHHRMSSNQSSIRSTTSNSSTQNKSNRPAAPPPAPPSASVIIESRADNSQPNKDSLHNSRLAVSNAEVKEGMLGVEYTTLNNKPSPGGTCATMSISQPASKDNQQMPPATQSNVVSADNTSPVLPLTRQESLLNCNSGLEKNGSFVKFSGYSGVAPVSPQLTRESGYKKHSTKKNAATTLVSDSIIGEPPQRKRGIMSKISNLMSSKKRSMSLDRLTVEAEYSKQGRGSLKATSTSNRPTILPGDKNHNKYKSEGFRSLGKTKFHSNPKLSVSLTDLVLDPKRDKVTTSQLQLSSGRTQSIESLLDSPINSPASSDSEGEELLTSGDKLTPSGILNYSYNSHNAFEEAIDHTQTLTEYFTTYCDTQWAPSLNADPYSFTKHIETLVAEGRQFVANSKQLVAGVTQVSSATDSLLVSKMAASIRTLAKIIQKGVEALKVATEEYNMTSLRECIVTLSEAYSDMLQTSYKAAGKSMEDENMMVIMHKASHLASLLSLFLKTLRSLHETDKV